MRNDKEACVAEVSEGKINNEIREVIGEGISGQITQGS